MMLKNKFYSFLLIIILKINGYSIIKLGNLSEKTGVKKDIIRNIKFNTSNLLNILLKTETKTIQIINLRNFEYPVNTGSKIYRIDIGPGDDDDDSISFL
jgi:hypothetical protein